MVCLSPQYRNFSTIQIYAKVSAKREIPMLPVLAEPENYRKKFVLDLKPQQADGLTESRENEDFLFFFVCH